MEKVVNAESYINLKLQNVQYQCIVNQFLVVQVWCLHATAHANY
jgi:hypothetical protein